MRMLILNNKMNLLQLKEGKMIMRWKKQRRRIAQGMKVWFKTNKIAPFYPIYQQTHSNKVGVATAATVGFVGDLSAQKMEGGDFDLSRSLAMTAFTSAYCGNCNTLPPLSADPRQTHPPSTPLMVVRWAGGIYAFLFKFYERAFTTARQVLDRSGQHERHPFCPSGCSPW